jgi:hypothetical protein
MLVALMSNFADRTTWACTAVVLMNNRADESTIYATLCCALIGAYYWRPSWTCPPTSHMGNTVVNSLDNSHAKLFFVFWGGLIFVNC